MPQSLLEKLTGLMRAGSGRWKKSAVFERHGLISKEINSSI
jgi:hypothetical protein